MKRPIDALNTEQSAASIPAPKLIKLAPIFQKPGEQGSESSTFRWLKQPKEKATLLHGINLDPPSTAKVAAFDLDGTLIISTSEKGEAGKGKSKDRNPLRWQWWKPIVPNKLKELANQGYSITIISNQALRSDQLDDWKKKIPLIAAKVCFNNYQRANSLHNTGEQLPDVPFRILAATAKDGYRKPMPGMWYELEDIFAENGIVIDHAASFFVGDAAGRSGDFASTDRKWALNVDVPFFTPEEYFLNQTTASFTLPGFNVSSLPIVPPCSPISIPLYLPGSANDAGSSAELVLFVGPPAVGKTSFFQVNFLPAGYVHVNQDTLKTRDKCLALAKQTLEAGKSVVIDNTNRDVKTRKLYVDLARSLGVPIRCFLFTGSVELARHNNLYRAFIAPPPPDGKPRRALLPELAFATFASAYEEPNLSEGYAELKRVDFIFEGTEQERKRWSMWLSTERK